MKVTVSHTVGTVSTSITLELQDIPDGAKVAHPGIPSPDAAAARTLTAQALAQAEDAVKRGLSASGPQLA